MDIQTALRSAIRRLRLAHIPSAAIDAELLLGDVTGLNREAILRQPDKKLSASQVTRYSNLIDARRRHRPLAYILGRRNFYGLDFAVDERVLIPRPSTEVLFETVLAQIRRRRPGSLADIGTGSGCLAVLFAKYLPQWQIFASDISSAAGLVAKKNARHHGVAEQITFLKGSLLTPFKEKKLSVIVANLPYVPAKVVGNQAITADRDAVLSTRWEPRIALYDGSPDGLASTMSLIEQSKDQLEPGGLLALETYPPAIQQVVDKALSVFPSATVTTAKDLSGQDHFVVVTQ